MSRALLAGLAALLPLGALVPAADVPMAPPSPPGLRASIHAPALPPWGGAALRTVTNAWTLARPWAGALTSLAPLARWHSAARALPRAISSGWSLGGLPVRPHGTAMLTGTSWQRRP
jgi:hypothetical protein